MAAAGSLREPDDASLRAHGLDAHDVCRGLKVDPNSGLSSGDARRRLQEYGRNELPEEEGTPLWKRFLEQFDDKLVKILLAAAFISLVLALEEPVRGAMNSGDFIGPLLVAFWAGEFVEAFVIMLILVCNAIVGVWQESNADKAIEALKEYAAPDAKCCRDGEVVTIKAVELVPGDIVEVAAGDKVPADIRVVEFHSTAVKTEQMALTGESASVNKQAEPVSASADLTDKKNILFSGTDVVYGKARGVVIFTGQHTLIGGLHKGLTQAEEKASPLKLKLDAFGDLLTNVIMVICVLVWLIHINHFSEHEGSWFRGAIYYFKIAVALAVAAIPEGLPAVVTTCLALGTRRMAKKNAIVRHLPSVETLGCTMVICSDKTGTLTTNSMSVMRVLTLGPSGGFFDEYDVEGTTFEPKGDIHMVENGRKTSKISHLPGIMHEIAKVSSLCNQSKIEYSAEKQVWTRQGESTEAALKVLAEKIGLPDGGPAGGRTPVSDYYDSRFNKQATLEFARDRKSMSVLCSEGSVVPGSATKSGVKTRSSARARSGPLSLYVKGAPESILARCTFIRRPDGKTEPLSVAIKEQLLKTVENDYASGDYALRCLALAVQDECRLDLDDPRLADPANFASIETGLTFLGVVGIRDPPRAEVGPAIVKCHRAGIRVIVITGDNKKTAEAICRQIGVFSGDEDLSGKSYTGAEFLAMPPQMQIEAVGRACLFSRTEPTHKQRLVELLQDHHHAVVAMTGDGVNDAPALKAADIGIAMGSGTAVAKEASRMVLADDNFTTIVNAVEEGRAIYNNTKAFIRYLISSNIGEVVCIFLAAALMIPEPLVPITLLWVNLVTDGLPATALSFNPPESDVMSKPPRSKTENLVDSWGFFRYMVVGVYVGVATVGGYIWWQLEFEGGPQVTFAQLRNWAACEKEGFQLANGWDCSKLSTNPFHSKIPMTVSLSILVTVEMFNALNALAENDSLLSTPPWVNPWLVGAIVLSFAQHFVILYTPVGSVFGVTALSMDEWKLVIALSFPIILIDEVLKFVGRMREASFARALTKSKKDG